MSDVYEDISKHILYISYICYYEKAMSYICLKSKEYMNIFLRYITYLISYVTYRKCLSTYVVRYVKIIQTYVLKISFWIF